MSMPPCGTFEYMAVVPAAGVAEPWTIGVPQPIALTGDSLRDDRLVGHAPLLTISDAGLPDTPQKSPLTGTVSPQVLRSRLALTASARKHARVKSAAFYVDRALIRAIAVGDTLFLARTASGGLGFSISRNGCLVAAVGAVSSLPLGDHATVGIPYQSVREAENVFRRHDPEFSFRELPVQIRLGQDVRLLYGGRLELGSYEVWVEHGYYPGVPGVDACVAVSLRGAVSGSAAIASAQLLDLPNALGMANWGDATSRW